MGINDTERLKVRRLQCINPVTVYLNGYKKIESDAFYGSMRLRGLYINEITISTIGSNAFPNSLCVIYVPTEIVNKYLKACPEFADFIKPYDCSK